MPWQPPRTDKAKSVALVAGFHLALGFVLISGLAGDRIAAPDDQAISLIDIPPPITPPEPPPPPPEESPAAARDEAGAVDLAAAPAPVVVPPPKLPLPTRNPLPTADDSAPVTGSAPSAGAGTTRGEGRGAGGTGDGLGGGGTGAGSGGGLGLEARLVSGNLTRRDYRRIRGFGSTAGRATLAIEVGPNGRVSRCMPLASSGDTTLDAELCRLLGRTSWEPARDLAGRPVSVSLRYVATWDRD
jgi:protein TonB